MTDDLEPRLRHHFERLADAVAAVSDSRDLDGRIAERRRRTTRAFGAALGVALIAGPAGGWALARVTDLDEQTTATAAGGNESSAGGSGPGAGGLTEGGDGDAYSDYLGLELPLLGERTTDEGLRLVLRSGRPSDSEGERPTDPCLADGLVRVGVTDQDLVGVVTMDTAPGWAAFGIAGAAEGRPLWVVVGRAAGGTVEARFPNGTIDRTEPMGGVAVLAAYAEPGSSAEDLLDDTIDTTGLNGESVLGDPRAVTSTAFGGAACPLSTTEPEEPPATMPAPGEAPADETAARAAIADTYVAAFDGLGTAEKARYYERSDVWLAASEEYAQSSANVELASSIYAEVRDIVFTAPDRAAVRYVLVSRDTGQPALAARVGEAVLIDGTWKVSIETSCGLLDLAGIECDL